MSNKASSTLHELIHSLSSAEKRYFKLFSKRHSSSNQKQYILLFDEILSQKEYDEGAILKKFNDSAFSNHFSISKNRLYHQILKSLDAFYAQDTAEAELSQYIHYSEILFHKALYNQCAKILNTASKIAEKYENWPAQLIIIKRQKRILELKNYENVKSLNAEELESKERELLGKIEKELDLWSLKSKLFQELFKKGQVRNPENIRKHFPLVESADKIGQSPVSTFESEFLQNHIKSAYYFSIANYKKSYISLKSNLNLMDSKLHLVKDEPSLYTSVLTNLVYVCAKLNRLDEADSLLKLSRNLPKALRHKISADLELRIFTNSYSLELAILNITADVRRSEILLKSLLKELKIWEGKLSEVRKASFYHGISTLYFALGQYKDALIWNNELLNSIHIDHSEDQYCFGQMFHLIIHYELGNFDVISHGLSSLIRYLDTRKRKYAFENHFVQLMTDILDRKQNTENSINRFKDELVNLESKPLERVALEYFDFLSWAEAKIENREFKSLLQEKAPDKDIL